MILQNTPLGNAWVRGATMFFLCNSLSIFSIWMVFNIVGRSQSFTGWLWLAVVVISLMLYMSSFIFQVSRLKYVIFILGAFVAIPAFIFCIVPFFIFLELAGIKSQGKVFLHCLYALTLLSWGAFQARKIFRLEKEKNYFEENVRVRGEIGLFYPDCTEMLIDGYGGARVNSSTKQSLAFVVPIILFGYPLQKFLTATGGATGVFAFLTLFTVPMAIHIFGKIFSGYFLWVYLASKFEVKRRIKIFIR